MNPVRCLLLVGVLVACAAGCARKEPAPPPKPSGPRKVVLQTDWFPQAEHGGFYQALAKGFYREAGLEVEIWPGGPGSGIKLKVARGDADFGMMRSDDLLLAAGSGMPLVMVAASLQHDPMGLMVHHDSPVKTFKDLAGRAVVGNVGMAYFPFIEKKFGVKLERRQTTFGIGEFLADPTAVQQCMVTNEPFFAEQNGRRVRTLTLTSAGYDCYHAIFTRRELTRTAPEVVRAFVRATIRGWRDYLEGDPGAADKLILQRNPQMTQALLTFARSELIIHAFVRGRAEKGEDIGQLALSRISDQMDTLLQLKVMELPVSIASVATKDFLPSPPRQP
jgi:NitT/TauT family transport system substrate-binding protein